MRVFGESNERTAMLAINYALLIEDETQAQLFLDEAVTIYQSLFGFGSEAMIEPLMRLGRSLSDGQQLRSAAEYYERALQLAITHTSKSRQAGLQRSSWSWVQLRCVGVNSNWHIPDWAKQRGTTAIALRCRITE